MSRARKPNGYHPRPKVHHVINRLRQERIIAGLTQCNMAEILGYSSQDIYKIESCRVNTRFQAILDYASYFNLDLTLIPKVPDEPDR
jgi:DNA-binding XRE family transcriptional regulator